MTDEPTDEVNVDIGDSSTDAEPSTDHTLRADIQDLRSELDALRADIDDRTVHRDAVEEELKAYVRQRQRRGHARGWGPYLVLLYGTIMTIGAFYLLPGGWAILAMVVIWLSTLGLYTLMIVIGLGLSILGLPGRLVNRFGPP